MYFWEIGVYLCLFSLCVTNLVALYIFVNVHLCLSFLTNGLTLIFDLFPGYLWMLIVRENREDVKEKRYGTLEKHVSCCLSGCIACLCSDCYECGFVGGNGSFC